MMNTTGWWEAIVIRLLIKMLNRRTRSNSHAVNMLKCFSGDNLGLKRSRRRVCTGAAACQTAAQDAAHLSTKCAELTASARPQDSAFFF